MPIAPISVPVPSCPCVPWSLFPQSLGPCSSNILSVPGLETQVMYVRGVGPRVAEMLAAKDIQTAEDLLYHLPFRYEDRQNPRSLDELKPGEMASVIAEVRGAALLRTKRMPIFEMTLGQGQRLALKCLWFNGTYLKDRFHSGPDCRGVRQGGAIALDQQPENDPAAVRDPARRGRRCGNAAARSGANHAGV